MKIAIFLTFDYSLLTWQNSGTLDKELKIYEVLSKTYEIDFTFYSYGTNSDIDLIKNYPLFKVVPLFNNLKFNNKLFKLIYSIYIPFKHKNDLKHYDILQQHQLLGSWVVIILKILLNKPVLIRTGYDMYEFSKYTKKRYSLKILLFYLLTKISLMFASIYTVSSKCDYKFLKENFRFSHKKIKIRPNWVVNNYIKDFENRYNYKIVSVGRLDNQKNYLELIKQFPKDSKFELIIYGDGPKKIELLKQIKKDNLKVTIKNNIPNNSLLEELNNYKFYISSSKFEGNPKSLLEAMSSGCIVFATNIKNHKEIINNKNGVLFDLKKLYFLDELIKIADNFEFQKKLSKNSIETVIKNNDLNKIASLFYDDYLCLTK